MNFKALTLSLAAAGTFAMALAHAEPAGDMGPGGPGRPGPHPMMAGPGMPPPDGPGHGLPFLHGLTLSDEQQDKLFNLMHASAPQVHEQEKALHKAHEAVRAMLESGQFDEAKAKSLTDSAAKAMAALELTRARTHAQVLAMLTPDQRKQLDAMPKHGPMMPPPRP